jgi:crotonobetaine/carnitine-CoA ligase
MTVPDQLEWERRFGGMARCSIYGQTECVEMVWAASDNLDLPRASAGKVAGDITLDIVDDDGKPLPTGEVGEMVAVAQTPHAMFSGYWSGPGQGKVDVSVGRVHHTGDRGRFDADGWFHYAERKSESIRRRGENVSSVQVEAVLEQYAAIAEAAVHDVPSSLSESEIKACVVLEEDATLDVEDFWEYCKSRIPYFAIPRYVEVLPSLPKNALLRVVKPTLRERGITEETLDLIALGYVLERGERRRSGDAK